MSDPNLDAADVYCSIQERAWDDFIRWCDERHPERNDMETLAEEYAKDCESGSWVISEWRV